MKIYIHEFSTGIQAEATADGSWVSQGFTGKYMNKTIDPIPRAVQEAISNRDFAVAEGASSDEPAFVGRQVAGHGEEWTVVAVVTRGRDDRGRSASMYRYFLSEGLGNLGKILCWLNAQKQAKQNIIFDPFDTQALEQPHEYSESNPDLPLRPELESLLEGSPPIIIPADSLCTPLIVNKMAQAIANERLIAWGYNVEALEEPRGFQVIQPASSRAEDLLKKAIASKPNAPAPVSGERAIISAINGLVKRDRVKPEQVETIENALGNPQICANYWESIFKGRGADKALKQGIYSADMVRLLTLRAMVIPDTLSEYLAWISKEGKQQESKEVSENFQAEIKKTLSQFTESNTNLIIKIYRGVVSIIPQLINQPQLLDSVVWLLSSDKGLWVYLYSRQVKSEIDNDLRFMRSYKRGELNSNLILAANKKWQKIFDEIQVCWRSRSATQPQYQPLAELFRRLGNYQLSALFYHICSGVVPKEVFYKLSRRGFYIPVYGIHAKRKIGSLESLCLKTVEIGGQIVPVYLVALLMVFAIPISFIGGKSLANSTTDNSEINPTQKSIKDLRSFFVEFEKDEQKINESIKLILKNASNDQNLEFNLNELGEEKSSQTEEGLIQKLNPFKKNSNSNAKSGNTPTVNNSDKIIKVYQNMSVKEQNNNGIIKEQSNTYKALKCDLVYELNFIEDFPEDICSNIFPKSKESIRKIIHDFVADSNKDKNNVENKITEIFKNVNGNTDITIAKIIQNNEQGENLIKKYQQEVVEMNSPDGKIDIDKNTFKVLKCHVAIELNIEDKLSNQDGCDLAQQYIDSNNTTSHQGS